MKSFRSTWLMSLVVIGLAVYTFFDYQSAQREGVYAEGERAAFTLDMGSVDTIVITRPQESIELRKQDNTWKMFKPVEDLAEDASVLGFLHSLTTQRIRLFNPQDEKPSGPVDWAQYGLDQPAVTFELKSGKKSESLSLSTKNAFDGSFYLRQRDELLIGDTGLAQMKERPASTLRSRLLWRENGPVETAQVESEAGSFRILKQDGQWTIEPKPAFALDAGKIEAWLERVQEFKPAEIAKDGMDEEDKKNFLLAKPSMQIRLNDNWLLTFGQDRGGDVFLHTNQSPTLYRISSQGISQVRVGADYFRDGRKAFVFPLELARTIEIRARKFSHSIKKVDENWVLQGDQGEVDQDKLVTFMQTLRGLEAREFTGFAKTGIASPQVIVKDEKGAELLSLAWGDEFKARAPYNNGQQLRYARTNLESEIMGLSKDRLDSLVKESLLKSPKAKETAEKK